MKLHKQLFVFFLVGLTSTLTTLALADTLPNGSVSTSVTMPNGLVQVTVTNADGSSVQTTPQTDGTSAVVSKDANGNVIANTTIATSDGQ